ATVEAQAALLRDLLPAAERFDARRVAARFHADAVAVVNRNRPMLQRLARRYRLGVVSNFTGNLRPCLEELELLALFAVTSDSAVLGGAKPDERIFRDTLAALGVGRAARGSPGARGGGRGAGGTRAARAARRGRVRFADLGDSRGPGRRCPRTGGAPVWGPS